MIVELIGVPGCGKTTYVKKYLQENNAENPLDKYLYNSSRITQNVNKCFLVIYFILYEKKYSAILYNNISKIKFKNYKTKLKMFLYIYSVAGAILKGKKNSESGNIIVDEGINQVIWGILYNSESSENYVFELQKVLKRYIADKIVWLDTPHEVVKQRLLERNLKGGAELSTDIIDDENALSKAYHLVDIIVDRLGEMDLQSRIIKYSSEE